MTARPFVAAHAVGEDWAHVAQACLDGLESQAGARDGYGNLGFVYATDLLAEDMSSILTYLRQRSGVEHWVGSVGPMVLGGDREYADVPALSVMVGDFPDDSFRVFCCLNHDIDELCVEIQAWAGLRRPPFGLVHAEPENPKVFDLIGEVAGLGPGFLVGSLVAAREGAARHQVADRVTGGGVSGVLFDNRAHVATALSQGCHPIGPVHEISDCVDNVVVGLDGRRALDVLSDDLPSEMARDLRRAAGTIQGAIPIEGSDTGDFVVRELLGVDPMRGWLALATPVEPGGRLMFVRRDSDTAAGDLARMAKRLSERLGPRRPRGGLYIGCVARGANLFGEPGGELALIRRYFDDMPLVGVHGAGEISGNRLYGHTGVLTLFL